MPCWLSNPWAKAGVTALSGLVAVALLFVLPVGGRRWMLLYYFVPVGVAFVAFALDRLDAWGTHSLPRVALDAVVVAWSATRAVYELPLASGHAIFLTYALLTGRSWPARVLAAVVLAETGYLKVFRWDDSSTFVVGVAVGLVASATHRWPLSRRPQPAPAAA